MARRKAKNKAAVELGSKGGKAKAAKMTPEERSELMKQRGIERMAKMTPEQRSTLSRKALKARWGKKKQS